jgi:hypothetical protein
VRALGWHALRHRVLVIEWCRQVCECWCLPTQPCGCPAPAANNTRPPPPLLLLMLLLLLCVQAC